MSFDYNHPFFVCVFFISTCITSALYWCSVTQSHIPNPSTWRHVCVNSNKAFFWMKYGFSQKAWYVLLPCWHLTEYRHLLCWHVWQHLLLTSASRSYGLHINHGMKVVRDCVVILPGAWHANKLLMGATCIWTSTGRATDQAVAAVSFSKGQQGSEVINYRCTGWRCSKGATSYRISFGRAK